MSKISYLTEEGYTRLKAELDDFISVKRPAISQQIADARDKGDLSENAEYDAAKEAQGMLEMKISQLQQSLRNSRILDETKLDTSKVQILNKVEIKNLKTNAKMEYTIVSEAESDLKLMKLSISTPIAAGLLGKKVGDKVDIKVPSGIMTFEITKISI